MVDGLTDLYVSHRGQIELGADGDLRTVSGSDNVLQAVRLRAKSVANAFVGDSLTEGTTKAIRQQLRERLLNDPRIDSVQEIIVEDIVDRTLIISGEVNYDTTFRNIEV